MKIFALLVMLILGSFAIVQAADAPTLHAIKIGTDINTEARDIAGEAESIPVSAGKVCCFIELQNIGEEKNISFKWYLGDNVTDSITKNARGWRWRTWTCKTNLGAGSWKVDIVLEPTGEVLGTKAFTVTP